MIKRKHRMKEIFALYKGDEFVTEGTIKEIHEKTGKSIKFLQYMTYPIYQKRSEGRVDRLRMVLLEDYADELYESGVI